MGEDLIKLDESIRAEADELLDDQRLRKLLGEYGKVHIAGSYALRLMVWRDLDIYLEADGLTLSDFFDLGGKLAASLEPVWMSFRNHRLQPHPTGLQSLYWGIRLGDTHEGAWKIDLHAMDSQTCAQQLAGIRQLASRLNEQSRLAILDIKSQCWQLPQFHRELTSMDIYEAVLDHGVTDMAGFRKYMAERGVVIQ